MGWIILVIVVIFILVIISLYNNLVRLRNKVTQAKSGIDVYLNQRFDLIPNLVECVKAYSKHEQDLLTEITNLRATHTNNQDNLKDAENLIGNGIVAGE